MVIQTCTRHNIFIESHKDTWTVTSSCNCHVTYMHINVWGSYINHSFIWWYCYPCFLISTFLCLPSMDTLWFLSQASCLCLLDQVICDLFILPNHYANMLFISCSILGTSAFWKDVSRVSDNSLYYIMWMRKIVRG